MNAADEILATLDRLRAQDVPTRGGRTLSYVYDSGLAEADEVGRRVLAAYAGTNGLDPTAFPSLLALENDLVATAAQLAGAPDAVGTVTSGGTESILLAVLAARDDPRNTAAQRDSPSMVVPTTAHAAFHKAAHYFGVRPVFVDVDPQTYRADPAAMARAVEPGTVLIVGSAPSYAHGVVDPIPQLAAIGAERGIRVHVDACIGGWVLPFLKDAPDWNLAVPGVTSLSVDLHKYAYTPKGVSILLHREPRLRRCHYFAAADWPGYTMLNTTMQSTKSGGPLAAAWAVVRFIGVDGYRALAQTAVTATRTVAGELAARDLGLRVLATPDTTLLAVAANDADLDLFAVADEMTARGWLLSPQLPFRGGPPSLHLSLCAATATRIDELLDALTDAVAAARTAGPAHLDPGLAQVLAALDPATLDEAAFGAVLAAAGRAAEGATLALPERMAGINSLLAQASPRLREALLLAFIDRLARPKELP